MNEFAPVAIADEEINVEPRQTNDLAVARPQPQSILDYANGLPEGQRKDFAAQLRAQLMERNRDKILSFEKKVWAFAVERMRTFRELADKRKFLARQDRNDALASGEVALSFNKLFDPSKESIDGGLICGFRQGWSFSAIQTAGSYIYSSLFAALERPFELTADGSKPDNKILIASMTPVVDRQFKRAGLYESVGRQIAHGAPRNGNFIVRYELVERLTNVKENGKWVEKRGEPEVVLTPWPVRDVLVSDPGRPNDHDQEVIWISKNLSLHDIDGDEATFDIVQDPESAYPVQKTRGKYVNLDRLRDAERHQSAAYRPTTDSRSDPDAAKSFPQIDLMDFEMALPFAYWIQQGDLTWEMCLLFELDMGIDGSTPEGMIEIGRRLNKQKFVSMSFVRDAAMSNDINTGDGRLVRLALDWRAEPKNSILSFGFLRDGEEYWKNSVADAGWRIEAMADAMQNSRAWTLHYNSQPGAAVDMRLTAGKAIKKVFDFLTPRKTIEKPANSKASDMIEFMQLPDNGASIDQFIQGLRIEHELSTGVLGVAKGDLRSRSNTLGQDQMNDAKGRNRLDDIVLEHSAKINYLVHRVISDLSEKLGKEGLIEYAARVAGTDANRLTEAIDSVGGIEEELRSVSPLVLGRNKQMIAQSIVQGITLAPQVYDIPKALVAYHQMSGVPNPESIINAAMEVSSPHDEHMQMRGLNMVKVNVNDDHAMHLADHEPELQEAAAEAQAIRAGVLVGDLLKAESYLRILSRHVLEHQQTVLALSLQAGAMPGVGGAGGAPADGPPDEEKSARGAEAASADFAGRGLMNKTAAMQ